MEHFPQYDENGEILSYQNIWRDISPQQMLGADCFTPFVDISNEVNKFILELTGLEFREMFSALMLGAEISYPDRHLQILANFLKMVHCPPTMEDEGGCINFKPYASFIEYQPVNPFNEPDLIPDGYINQPFHFNSDFAYPELLGFQNTDVLVPLDAIPVFGDWGDVLGLHFPTIKLHVVGQGQIEVDFLAITAGGQCIVKVGSPPNIFDIIDGIIETGVKIIDLGQDITAIPPESDLVIAEEINIDAPEGTDVYFVFVPKIDVSTDFFGMGGGIRQIGLCGLETDGTTMGIEDMRWSISDDVDAYGYGYYKLQKRVAGVWEDLELTPEVGEWMRDGQKRAVDAWGYAYSIRNIEDEFISMVTEDDQGWLASPLKDYIDNKDEAQDTLITALGIDIASAIGTASAAAAAAAGAQTTADGAVSVNTTQNSVITGILGDISDIEDAATALGARMLVAEADILFIDSRVDALELRVNDLDSGGAWHHIDDFTAGDQGYTPTFGSYVAGVGFQASSTEIVLEANRVYYNEITDIQVVIETSGTAPAPEIQLGWEGSYISNFYWDGNTPTLANAWLRVPNQTFKDDVRFRVRILTGGGTFAVKYVRYLGKGEINPFA